MSQLSMEKKTDKEFTVLNLTDIQLNNEEWAEDHKNRRILTYTVQELVERIHPDLITVDDPEHKNVAVKVVRQAREDMYIRPNESAHKIYLFPQELNVEGQYFVRYQPIARNTRNTTLLKKDLPDLYKAYLKVVNSTRFTISPA